MSDARPNILYIMTDQQNWRMMSCTGNPNLRTPNMDRLAAGGTRFDCAYSSNPVCLPARMSMMTGRFPSHYGISWNTDREKVSLNEAQQQEALGWTMRRAGYDTWFGGKMHWVAGMSCESIGFIDGERSSRDLLAQRAAEYIKGTHEKPFFAVVSLENPHDICYLSIDAYDASTGGQLYPQCVEPRAILAEALSAMDGRTPDEFADECPSLPDNYEIPDREPDWINAHLDDFNRYVRENWSDSEWRLQRYAYCRLTERVDRHVGTVLDALHESGLEEDTLVIFSSDHGDMDAAHRLEHKTVFYDESARVPFIIRYPGNVAAGRVDERSLVGASTDLFQTICDYADAEPPPDLPGASLRQQMEEEVASDLREMIVSENPGGRMVRTDRFKYCAYYEGEIRESLVDMVVDPGEMNNLAGMPEHDTELRRHRELLAGWTSDYGDTVGADLLESSDQ